MSLAPYYSHAGIAIYHGDCREVLPTLADESIDLVLTDPPYGISHPCDYADRGRAVLAQAKNYPQVHGDDEPFDPRWLLELGKAHILFGANYFANLLPPIPGWLVWDKLRPDELDQATCELAWTDCVKGVRRFRYLWHGMLRDGDDELRHPTQKPVALMQWCMGLRWTKDFQNILDPFCGSGTTLVAAKLLGRKAIGCEIEERYCEIAAKRLSQEVFDFQEALA
jgi:DNA modification methylase